jgi:thiosulfate/3-mercaptopyruvate sulfurtransferase
LLAPADQISDVMGRRGIDNSMKIIAYDDNDNMDAARLWWTLKFYGNDNVKVVSGGLKALLEAGAKISEQPATVLPKEYKITSERKEMIALSEDLRELIDKPRSNAVIIDTRSKAEYNDEGTIPGSVLIEYKENNFSDSTYKPVQQIRIRYLEDKIDYDKEIYMFCKTSIRGAQTYLALYNAGYRNLKLYDGAWVEWTANPMNPVYKPEQPVYMINSSDNS